MTSQWSLPPLQANELTQGPSTPTAESHPHSTHQPIPGQSVSKNPNTAFNYRTHRLCTPACNTVRQSFPYSLVFETSSHQVSSSCTVISNGCIASRKHRTRSTSISQTGSGSMMSTRPTPVVVVVVGGVLNSLLSRWPMANKTY